MRRTSVVDPVARAARAMLALSAVRLGLALAAIAVVTVWFLLVGVFLTDTSAYVFFGVELSAAQKERISPLFSYVLVYPVLAFTASRAASAVVRRISGGFIVVGALIGLLGAALAQLLLLRFPDSALWEALVYGLFGILGGAIGGLRGKDRRFAGELREKMEPDVLAANTPEGVLGAVGEHLGKLGARTVVAWRLGDDASDPSASDTREGSPRLWAFWPDREGPPAAAENPPNPKDLESVFAGPGPLLIAPEYGPAEAAWLEYSRAGSALLLGISSPAGERVGLIAVAFAPRRRLPRPLAALLGQGPVPRIALRGFAAAGPRIAVALDRVHQAQKAQESGERLAQLRMRRVLHDDALQNVLALERDVARFIRTRRVGDEGADELNSIRASAREAISEMRRVVRDQRPAPLEEGIPLPEALERLAERTERREGPLRVGFEPAGEPSPLPEAVEDALYTGAKEALNNVVKHAGARRAQVTLSYFDSLAVLDVIDDGVGPADAGPDPRREGGDGLRLLRERVEGLGGTVSLGGGPSGGTTFSVRLPTADAAR